MVAGLGLDILMFEFSDIGIQKERTKTLRNDRKYLQQLNN